jgi:hypothetical protein
MFESAKLKVDFSEEVSYDEIIAAIFQFVESSESMIGKRKCALAAFARNLAPSERCAGGEEEHQKIPGSQILNEHPATLASLSAERRLG